MTPNAGGSASCSVCGAVSGFSSLQVNCMSPFPRFPTGQLPAAEVGVLATGTGFVGRGVALSGGSQREWRGHLLLTTVFCA